MYARRRQYRFGRGHLALVRRFGAVEGAVMSSRVWIMLAAAIAAMILLLLVSPTAFPAEIRH